MHEGEKDGQLVENARASPFIAAQNGRTKQAEGNQLLAKLALLAMTPQCLNKKRTCAKNDDCKEINKFNFDFKNMFYDI